LALELKCPAAILRQWAVIVLLAKPWGPTGGYLNWLSGINRIRNCAGAIVYFHRFLRWSLIGIFKWLGSTPHFIVVLYRIHLAGGWEALKVMMVISGLASSRF